MRTFSPRLSLGVALAAQFFILLAAFSSIFEVEKYSAAQQMALRLRTVAAERAKLVAEWREATYRLASGVLTSPVLGIFLLDAQETSSAAAGTDSDSQ